MASRRPGASGAAATACAMRCSVIWPSPAIRRANMCEHTLSQAPALDFAGAPQLGARPATGTLLHSQAASLPPHARRQLTLKPDAGLLLHGASRVAPRQAQADSKLDLGIQVDKGQGQGPVCREELEPKCVPQMSQTHIFCVCCCSVCACGLLWLHSMPACQLRLPLTCVAGGVSEGGVGQAQPIQLSSQVGHSAATHRQAGHAWQVRQD